MSLISIGANQFTVNKFLVYAIIMSFLAYPTIMKDCFYAIAFKKTKGMLESFTFTDYIGRGGRQRTKYYPVVTYRVGDTIYQCLGSEFQHDGHFIGDSLPVIYHPQNPSNAFVYTYLGFWAPELVYVIPLSIVLTLMTFSDSIPKNLTIRR